MVPRAFFLLGLSQLLIVGELGYELIDTPFVRNNLASRAPTFGFERSWVMEPLSAAEERAFLYYLKQLSEQLDNVWISPPQPK